MESTAARSYRQSAPLAGLAAIRAIPAAVVRFVFAHARLIEKFRVDH